MSDRQLIEPNLSVVGESGECLVYVREIFGIGAKYPDAANAWENAAYKFPGEQPPTDVVVPVWFSYDGPTNGHVAVSVPGKGIYSVSAQGDKVFGTIAELEAFIPGTSYLGWSEDVDGGRVAEPTPAPAPAPEPSPAPTTGQTINLPATTGPWHLYKPGGPYDPDVAADVIAVVHPADYAPEGITYPIEASLGNGVYRIKSPAHGVCDIWTKGSTVIIG